MRLAAQSKPAASVTAVTGEPFPEVQKCNLPQRAQTDQALASLPESGLL
jgi:hypothetical protein